MSNHDDKKAAKLKDIRDDLSERGWFQPTPEFKQWWNPTGFDPATGAQIGGHECALRCCVHLESGEKRKFGISAAVAFNTKSFREEWRAWMRDGQPERLDLNSGLSAHPDDALAALREVKAILKGSPLAKGMLALESPPLALELQAS